MKKTFYDKITKKYQKPLMKSLKEFVSINSVYDESSVSKENPFGIGVSHALQYIADLAQKDGFVVNNYDNMIVEILYGKGEKNLTIMAHADVVPAGTGWKHDPFTVTEKHGVIGGRGVADDKGPLLACYYGLKALRDNGLLGGYEVRFLVGGNEESGSRGVEHYFKDLKKPQPTLGFSPDSDFPLIFAEKGIINFEVKKKIILDNVFSISGGVAPNSVIERCELSMKEDSGFITYLNENNYHFEIEKNSEVCKIIFIGKAAHGALPELGLNAGILALKALANYYKNKELMNFVNMYSPLDGSGYMCNAESPEMGHNSSNVGLLSYDDGLLKCTVNFRYTDVCTKTALISKIKEVNKPDTISVIAEAPLLFFKRDSLLISTLLKSYQDETGDLKSKPLAIGGGTYAKEADNCVAFGMQFPGWESNMHSPGESVLKKDLFKGMAIFARAIVDLGKNLRDYED